MSVMLPMSQMFRNALVFNSDLNMWNVGSVVIMDNIRCYILDQNVGL